MVLDTMKKDEDGLTKFFFKNTYEEKKQVKIKVDSEEAPDEFFFVHIKYAKQISLAKAINQKQQK